MIDNRMVIDSEWEDLEEEIEEDEDYWDKADADSDDRWFAERGLD